MPVSRKCSPTAPMPIATAIMRHEINFTGFAGENCLLPDLAGLNGLTMAMIGGDDLLGIQNSCLGF